jgi:hypothetical protein
LKRYKRRFKKINIKIFDKLKKKSNINKCYYLATIYIIFLYFSMLETKTKIEGLKPYKETLDKNLYSIDYEVTSSN